MKNKERFTWYEEMAERAFDRINGLEAAVAILQERDKERMEKAAQPATPPAEKPWQAKQMWLSADKVLVLRDLRDRIRRPLNYLDGVAVVSHAEVMEVLDQIFGGKA